MVPTIKATDKNNTLYDYVKKIFIYFLIYLSVCPEKFCLSCKYRWWPLHSNVCFIYRCAHVIFTLGTLINSSLLISPASIWSTESCALRLGPSEARPRLRERCWPAFFVRRSRKCRPRVQPWYWLHVSRGPRCWHSVEGNNWATKQKVCFHSKQMFSLVD